MNKNITIYRTRNSEILCHVSQLIGWGNVNTTQVVWAGKRDQSCRAGAGGNILKHILCFYVSQPRLGTCRAKFYTKLCPNLFSTMRHEPGQRSAAPDLTRGYHKMAPNINVGLESSDKRKRQRLAPTNQSGRKQEYPIIIVLFSECNGLGSSKQAGKRLTLK